MSSTILDKVMTAPEVADAPSGYLESLVEQAKATILSYIRRAEWPGDEGSEDDVDNILDAACVRLTLAFYRRGGSEHAATVGLGDMSVSAFDPLPPEITLMLRGKRRIALAADYEDDD